MRFKPDIVIAPSPPLTIGLNAWAIAVVRRAKYIYNVQEIYPDIAINLGIMKNRLAIRFFSWLERFIYRKASCVTSITPGMCEKIASRTEPSKVKMVSNFVDLSDVLIVSRDNDFAKEHDLRGKFVLTYAGNMGVPQKLDVIVELARRIPELTVLFVGGGGDAVRLRELARGLENVKFVDYQPICRMPEIYAASDLFYVGQDPQACSDGIPSKIYRILGYGKPLLVMTRHDSDLAEFVKISGGGQLINEDIESAVLIVRELMSDVSKLKSLGESGRRYVENAFSRENISARYDSICRELV
jgi:colanic acid biosynthesis glycosyl transferase WcaI